MSIVRNVIVAITICCALASVAAAGQGERYIVVLKAVKSDQTLRDDDVRKLGGTVDNRTWDKIFVTLPPGAAETLRQHPAVRYMQAIGGSGSAATSSAPSTAPSLMRLHPMPNQSPPSWSSGTYSYDGSGNIYKIGAAGAESGDGMATTYSYDLLSRLKKVESVRSATGAVGTPRTENYSYDVYGNLTLTTEGDGSQRNLTVAASSNRYQTSPDTGMAAVYDVAGRMTIYGTDVYKYDAANMMTERDHDGWSDFYVYSADDERAGVRVGDTWTWSFRDASGKVLRQYQSSASNPSADWLWVEDYVYAGGRLLTAERPAEEGGRRHFHLDHLGTPRLITGAFGELVSQHDMTAFGAEITAPTQELTAGFDREEPMKFTGHERDFTGPYPGSNYLDYMHARGFTPALGRFLSVDPKLNAKAALKHPQIWNRYSYSIGNPFKFTDPTGEEIFLVGDSLEKRRTLALLKFMLHNRDAAKSLSSDKFGRLVITGISAGDWAKKFGGDASKLAALIQSDYKLGVGAISADVNGSGRLDPVSKHYGLILIDERQFPQELFGTMQYLDTVMAHELYGHGASAAGTLKADVGHIHAGKGALYGIGSNEADGMWAENQYRSMVGLPLRQYYAVEGDYIAPGDH